MINRIIAFSINNKAIIWLFTAAIVIGGIYSINKIPLDAVPDITNNQVLVITTAPNLSTEDIEQFVSYKVELAVANLPGVTEIRSVSRFGLSVVTIVFEDNMGTYLPRQLVSEVLLDLKSEIPDGFGEPIMAPISSGLGEIYQYTLEVQEGYDSIYDDMELRTIQDWIVKRQMAMLPGVVEVNSFGGRRKQFEVTVNPDKLRSMGITITEIFDALKLNNQNTGGAYIEKDHKANFIRGEGLMRSKSDILNTKVANIDGQPIFIRDVADVRFGSFLRYGAFTKNGKGEAVGGIVMMLKGENSNQIIKNVKERMALIQESLPEGILIKPFLDRSKLIKSTTSTITENLAIGALIVIFILVFFLGNLRGGLIVASTIPLALLFAFIMMYVFDIWANLMSLGAIDFGILVDGAVIIVESMIFYLHKNKFIGTTLSSKKRDKIAYKTSSRMMNSAFFGQLIILIVFIPVMVLEGIEGKMFKPMALTFAFAVLGVVILCLTYIPMMSALLLRPPKKKSMSWGDKIVVFTENIYKYVITNLIGRSKTVLVGATLILALSIFTFTRMGAEFIPQLDEGDFAFQAFLKPGTSLTDVKEASTQIEKIVFESFPDEIESIQSRIGVADLPMDPMPIDIADVFVILKPQENWTKASSKQDLINQVRDKLKVLTGINFEFTQPIEMRFNELLTGIREDVAVKIYGEDLHILEEKANDVAEIIYGIEGIAGIKVEATSGLPQITINYDRNKLGVYDLNINDLNQIVESAFSGGKAGVIYEGEKMYDLVVRLDEQHRSSIGDIKNLFITLKDNNQIPLKEVANISYKPGPMQISRDNTNRRIYVGINVEDRDIKSLVDEIRNRLDKNLNLPPGYYIRYGGAFENLQRATDRLTLVLPLALILIFILVYLAVRSLKQTLIIYLAVPFAAVGGIFSLYFRDMPFSISAGIGFIVLFGVAVLNGLVLLNSYNELKENGEESVLKRIIQGSTRRIRPIFITASTDIMGFIPMAVSNSAGAEVQRPLATVVIGGMISATILTLIVIPILYNLLENKKFKMNINSNKLKTVVLTIAILLAIPAMSFAQKEISLQQSIDIALKNYPGLKAAASEVKKQKTLSSTAMDFGTTSIYTGAEEFNKNNSGIQNIIGIEQSEIDIFGIAPKKNLSDSRERMSEAAYELTKRELTKDVSISWYKASFSKKKLSLLLSLDSVYSDFLRAAQLKYETQQSSKLELLSASAKSSEMVLKLNRAKSNYRADLKNLNKYLLMDTAFEISSINNLSFENGFSEEDTVVNSSISDYYLKKQDVFKMKWRLEKNKILPKINMSFASQKIAGQSGFYASHSGINLPLVFNTQNANNKAAKINYEIASYNYERVRTESITQIEELLILIESKKAELTYFKEVALPLADEQLQAAKLAYYIGDLDYMQFLQNTETAYNTQLDYLKSLQDYFLLIEDYKYLAVN